MKQEIVFAQFQEERSWSGWVLLVVAATPFKVTWMGV
jgi:hypothetical protein